MDIETFAHIVAHDMKAPLHGIASMVDFVVEDYGDRLDDEGRQQLRLIQQMAVRGVAMVDGLRRFSRVASAPVQSRRLDLTAMAGRAVARSAALAPDATVRPRVAALPAVLGDPALVARRDKSLEAVGVRLLRFPAQRVLDETDAVVAEILAAMKASYDERGRARRQHYQSRGERR